MIALFLIWFGGLFLIWAEANTRPFQGSYSFNKSSYRYVWWSNSVLWTIFCLCATLVAIPLFSRN